MKLKYGKLAPKHSPKQLYFADYRTSAALPPVPATFGHASLIPDWEMLGNDELGDCAIAMILHLIMYWSACAGVTVRFTLQNAVDLYSAVTGYDPNDPSTDQGTVLVDLLEYVRKHGVKDADGKTHFIGAYVALRPRSLTELREATYLFGGSALGIQVPSSAQPQFEAKEPWTVVKRSPIEGGHAICCVQRDTYEEIVTWGALQAMTDKFYQRYNDEAYAILSPDYLAAGKTIEGFDLAALQADLREIGAMA